MNPIYIPYNPPISEKIEKNKILKNSLGQPDPTINISVFGSNYGNPGSGYFSTSTTNDSLTRKWVYNTKNIDDIIKYMEECGYSCEVGKDGYNAPEIKCTHIKTQKYLDKITKSNDEKFKDLPVVYIRFGKSPKTGYSIDYSDNKPEKGVSVFEAKIAKNGDYRIINANHIMQTTYSIIKDRPIYVLYGDEVGRGADGEPVIKVKKEIPLEIYLKNEFH